MARKITPKIESQEAFGNIQFTKPADQLIEAIKQHSERIRGEVASKEYVEQTINQIVESRLSNV